MRGYDFLDKLSLVDPAYIEAADLMPKKKTSWLKWGIAACLTLVLCTVTVFCLSARLPKLPVSLGTVGIGYGFEGYWIRDISDLKNTSPVSTDAAPSRLPVFRNPAGGYPVRDATEEYRAKMLTLSRTIEGRLVRNTEKMTETWTESDGRITPLTLLAKGSDDVEIRVDQFMTAEIWYPSRDPKGEDYPLPRTYEETYQLAVKLLKEYRDLLGFAEPQICITGGDYDKDGKQFYDISIYDATGSNTDHLLQFFCRRANFYCNTDGEPWLIRMLCSDLSDEVGNYPIITAQQAQKLLVKGHCISSCPYEMPGEKYIRKVELIYRCGIYDEYFMPYYRFYVELPEDSLPAELQDGEFSNVGAYYVPAVEEEYLAPLSTWDGQFN